MKKTIILSIMALNSMPMASISAQSLQSGKKVAFGGTYVAKNTNSTDKTSKENLRKNNNKLDKLIKEHKDRLEKGKEKKRNSAAFATSSQKSSSNTRQDSFFTDSPHSQKTGQTYSQTHSYSSQSSPDSSPINSSSQSSPDSSPINSPRSLLGADIKVTVPTQTKSINLTKTNQHHTPLKKKSSLLTSEKTVIAFGRGTTAKSSASPTKNQLQHTLSDQNIDTFLSQQSPRAWNNSQDNPSDMNIQNSTNRSFTSFINEENSEDDNAPMGGYILPGYFGVVDQADQNTAVNILDALNNDRQDDEDEDEDYPIISAKNDLEVEDEQNDGWVTISATKDTAFCS